MPPSTVSLHCRLLGELLGPFPVICHNLGMFGKENLSLIVSIYRRSCHEKAVSTGSN
jgi:hypothetical protein